MNRRTLILALLATAASGTALYARQIATPAKIRIVDFASERFRNASLPGGGGNVTTMTGNVVITSEDSTLNTQKATYNDDTQIANSPTRVIWQRGKSG